MKLSKNNTTFYKPSWIDHFTNRIDVIPGPSWAYYSGLGVLLLCIQSATFWIEGALPMCTFLPASIFLSAAIPFIIVILPYFNDKALTAIEIIKPLLTIEEDEYETLAYQLQNLPALKSILASVLLIIFVFLMELIGGGTYYFEDLLGYPLSLFLSRSVYLVCWWFFGVFIYHTIHQLRLISLIYSKHTRIDLFRMNPLYGFSGLAALTAGSLIMLPYGFLLINPEVQLADPAVLIIYLSVSFIALITFLWPQLGIHQLQKNEQAYLIDEINQRYKATMSELHRRVDTDKFDDAATLVSTLGALNDERKTINGISTWPWQPETIRWFFTAMILPLLMWVAQYFLGQWLG